MEVVSVKFEKSFLHDIEIVMRRHRYATKTEFIREAVRDKVNDLEKEEAIRKLAALKGSLKGKAKMSIEEAKRRAFAELVAEHKLSLN